MTDVSRPATSLRVVELCGSAAGGVRAHLLDCATVLSRAGHDVCLMAPAEVLARRPGEHGPVADGAGSRVRARVLELGPRPGAGDARLIAQVRRQCEGADVVHAHGLRAGAVAVLAVGGLHGWRRRRRRPLVVVTEHNRVVGGAAVRAVGRVLARLVARRADVVLGVSPDLVEQAVADGARQVRLAVVPAPRAGGDRAEAGAVGPGAVAPGRLPWANGQARVLTVARLAPQKGLDLLADAAALVPGMLRQAGVEREVVWAVAGEGPERAGLEARVVAESLPVTLLGRRDDVVELMAGADVVVQTSLWEGQPLTVQEALRVGAALVATDVGGTAVTARGGAVLVEPRAQALAGAIVGLLSDEDARARARRAARAASERMPGEADLLAQLEQVLAAAGRA